MAQVVSIRTKVLHGGRVEVIAPGFAEGDLVDVLVRQQTAGEGRRPMLDLIGSVPTKTAAEWEELERALREERDAWDR
jgi:hypothetical protein